ncbi:MAG: hypothetical protein KDD84_07030, partial [Caldilineaceae bacterium]|nr:hypothetical protein [Caldilineaceae bacterium]
MYRRSQRFFGVILALLLTITPVSETLSQAHQHSLPQQAPPTQDDDTVFLPLVQGPGGSSPNIDTGRHAPPELAAPSCSANTTPLTPELTILASDAGFTQGAFEVNASGAAVYRIPLVASPGTAGIQPDLALVYNSQGGDGIAGVGWSVAGLSAIGRCPTTVERNGSPDPVDFDDSDLFCLDGQPLLALDGTYGANGTEYRTEIDNLSRIISYGQNGSGPNSFQVWTKAGLHMTYGSTADAQVRVQGQNGVLGWAVNRIEDSTGNYLTVAYHRNDVNGEQYPYRIRYTGNSNAEIAPYNLVEFHYEARPKIIQRYVAGAQVEMGSR